ncbi:MAG: SDR family NAD(P)-dependent oxidoreductase [Rhodospirillaceae bacterium]|nr:SDR family NAD(P)-dependent oxidoreductase [Rhodospirillaceae bacterium]MBT4590275.1 SDR family NAD(P)-dependent oxidoreductase [Rhodospirillaceae bacterium]MBT5940699.1 SDR family NAD(P)-dependent oxidoreductase [Rhodospirillaceae bacterium]MBT7265937.1 SDR family NAD(P)-dependent oxidoreductase [Rhodospirillaceae bacterium]
MADQQIAVIVGAGAGLSASLARKFSGEGMKVALAARDTAKLADLVAEVDGQAYTCDTADPASVQALFSSVIADLGVPEVVVFNASRRVRGEITEIDPDEVREAILTTCYGGFLVGQEAAKVMLLAGHGTIMFTGASAGVKGFPKSATFAMGKFGLRGLAQSMARELHPQNIHVVHVVVDGGIRSEERDRIDGRGDDGWLLPDAIADTYYHLHMQHRSSWSWEIEVRPWTEGF